MTTTTKTQRQAQKRRGTAMRRRLKTIAAKLRTALCLVNGRSSNDAENLAYKLEEALRQVNEGTEFYCEYL